MPLSAEENVLLDKVAERIHREGVIEGLGIAAGIAFRSGQIETSRVIKSEIERLRGEKEEQP